MQLLLIRHGQSEWNAARRWQGRADTPLTELGRQQAFRAARRVGTVDAIVASPLSRASETATIISGQVGVGPVALDDGLVERDVGEWSGLTRQEIDDRWPGLLESGERLPSFESDESVLHRVRSAFARIRENYDGAESVLVVCHGGVVHALEQMFGLVSDSRVSNLAGRRFGLDGTELTPHDRLDLLEDEDDMRTTPGQL